MGYGEAKSHSLLIAPIFRREIRVEYLVKVFLWDARTFVLDGNPDVFPRLRGIRMRFVVRRDFEVIRGYPECAATRHRFPGICDDSGQGLAHLVFIDLDPPQLLGHQDIAHDARTAQCEADCVFHQFADGNLAFWRSVPGGECDEFLCEVPCAQARFLSLRQMFGCRVLLLDLGLCHAEVAENDKEKVIEIVRDAARKYSYGFKLFGVEQFFLDIPVSFYFLKRGNIHSEHEEPAAPFRA